MYVNESIGSRTLIAEAEKARFWKRLTVRRAANMTAIVRCVKEEEGEGEIPVKEIGPVAPHQFPSSRAPRSKGLFRLLSALFSLLSSVLYR